MTNLESSAKASDGVWKAAEYVPDPYGPDAPVPETWTPDHVARRLIEAFRVDRRMPRIESPKQPGSAYPSIEYSREEMEIWETVPLDPSRFIPTRAEISAMEVAFGWLRLLLSAGRDNELMALRAWAIAQVSSRKLRVAAKIVGTTLPTLLMRKSRALGFLSDALESGGETW